MASSTAESILPLTDTIAPADQQELAEAICQAVAARTPLYAIGGGTSLDYGLPPRAAGLGLSLANLTRVIDYPARDMTITVEAGVTLAELARTLAAERQCLAVDAAQADRATLGGLVATNFSGPRRYGCGTVRDYVIGISAVDGRGTQFKAGGRVVKNVAGYDICKLLTGSLGTLAVVTQVTLKLRPVPEASCLVACDLSAGSQPDADLAERLLAALVTSQVAPAVIELVAGPEWRDDPALAEVPGSGTLRLVVGLEGTSAEVAWMSARLAAEWAALGVRAPRVLEADAARSLGHRLVEFPAAPAPRGVLRAAVKPSSTLRFMGEVWAADPEASLQAHAGNGVVLVRLARLAPADLGRCLVRTLHPAASAAGGSMVVYATPDGADLTRQACWGGGGSDAPLMRAVKDQFDPQGLLNPGRFVYGKS
jgi:glycolate oxidase FAD binding subunit